MLSNQYIFPTKFFRHIINTATIRVLQKFHHHYHGDCRILANGMQICHLECHYPDSTPVYSDSPDEEEEDFPTVPLDDKHWTLEIVL